MKSILFDVLVLILEFLSFDYLVELDEYQFAYIFLFTFILFGIALKLRSYDRQYLKGLKILKSKSLLLKMTFAYVAIAANMVLVLLALSSFDLVRDEIFNSEINIVLQIIIFLLLFGLLIFSARSVLIWGGILERKKNKHLEWCEGTLIRSLTSFIIALQAVIVFSLLFNFHMFSDALVSEDFKVNVTLSVIDFVLILLMSTLIYLPVRIHQFIMEGNFRDGLKGFWITVLVTAGYASGLWKLIIELLLE